MITVKYCRKGDLSYVSHIDITRMLMRTVKRMGVEVAYSGGFNPHMLLYTSAPLPLGIQSECEYMMLECPSRDTDGFLALFNGCVPRGLEGIKAFHTPKKPSLVADVNYFDYTIDTDIVMPKEAESIVSDTDFRITYSRKGELTERATYGMVKEIAVEGKRLYMRVAAGLRIDAFVKAVCGKFGADICVNDTVRVAQIIDDGKSAIDADEYLRRLGE